MKVSPSMIFFIVTLLLGSVDASAQGVKIVQSSDLTQIIADNPKLLLFFSDNDCLNCQECSQIYALTNQIHPESAKYAKIYLSNTTKSTFIQYNITNFPTILAFINGKQSPYDFQCLGTKSNMKQQMFKWIERLDNSLKEWGEEEDHEHQLIVHCDSDDRKKMWKKIERTHLWLDLYCGKQSFLGDNVAVVSEYGRSIEAWQLQPSAGEEQRISRLIKAYQYKYVLNWNTAIAQQIFLKNQSAFVLLVNNQSLSMTTYNLFEQIKQNWYENAQKYEPVLFAVSDLSRNTYETIRLKRYLTGVTTATKKDYPYPMLAFIHAGLQRPKKYLMTIPERRKQTIALWMQQIHNHILLNQSYHQNEFLLRQWLNEDLIQCTNKSKHQRQSDEESNYFQADEQVKYLKTQDQWTHLLSKKYVSPFFVYFTWRFDYKMQLLQSDIVYFWEKQNKEGVSPMSRVPLFVHQLHSLDLPFREGLEMEFLPSICFVDREKRIQMRQGVTDFAKIKAFYLEKVAKQTRKEIS